MTDRRLIAFAATTFLIAACAPSSKSADTTGSLPAPPDTVKPVIVSAADSAAAAASDSAKRAAANASRNSAKQTTSKQSTSTQTKSGTARDTAHLGRDSVIRFDPKDPRRQLPPVKKPPL